MRIFISCNYCVEEIHHFIVVCVDWNIKARDMLCFSDMGGAAWKTRSLIQ